MRQTADSARQTSRIAAPNAEAATRDGLVVGQVVITTNEITAATGEQSDGSCQVKVAGNQLDQMTQQNAALVEQRSAAAESLKDQATRLAQVVQVFRISA